MKLNFEGFEMQKLNVLTDRAPEVYEKNGVICLVTMFTPRVMIIKMSKMAHLSYSLLVKANINHSLGKMFKCTWKILLSSFRKWYACCWKNSFGMWKINLKNSLLFFQEIKRCSGPELFHRYHASNIFIRTYES